MWKRVEENAGELLIAKAQKMAGKRNGRKSIAA
jgi:hypothetical protein